MSWNFSRKSLMTLLVLLAVEGTAHAQGASTVAWAAGYPKTGGLVGELAVQFTVTLDKGYSIMQAGGVNLPATVEFWVSGKTLYASSFTLVNQGGGVWQANGTAIGSTGVTYNLVANAFVTDGKTKYTLRTATATAQAK